MSKTSRKAAKKWRKNQAPLASRWYVSKSPYSGLWIAFSPCSCEELHMFCGHVRRVFRTHAEAIAWADNQARQEGSEL